MDDLLDDISQLSAKVKGLIVAPTNNEFANQILTEDSNKLREVIYD